MSDTTAVPAAEPEDTTGRGAHEAATFRYLRSPVDVLHIVVYGTVALLVLGITAGAERSITDFEEELISLLDFLTPSVERVLAGVMQALLIIGALVTVIVPIALKRYRLLMYVVVGNVGAFLLTMGADWLVDRGESVTVINRIAERAGIDELGITSVHPVAQLAAGFTVFAPFVSRAWRRAGLALIGVIVLLRIVVAFHLPAGLFYAVPIGAAVGAGVLYAFGRPDRRPTLEAIEAALVESGLPVTSVRAAKVDARGSTPYFATLADGSGLFVKVLGNEQRAADLLFRIYRYLRLKNVGDERPFSSLRRTVEHEALVALLARDVGIRTPRVRGVVAVGEDSMLLAYDMIDGVSVDSLADEAVTDEVMRGVWQQVALLRAHRIAHRDLRRANVFMAEDGTPWIIDFGFSELAVDDGLLHADVAQLMAAFAVVAEPERVVRVAIEVLGKNAVATALPRLQEAALSGATQAALKQRKGRLEALQQEVMSQAEVGELHLEPLTRVNGKTIFMIIVLVAATYFLIPQLADLPGIVDQVSDANWEWLPLALATSMLTYIGATFSLRGAVPDPLPIGPTFATQLGSSFASKIAPAGLGGMALNARYLQKSGVDEAVAVTSVGLNTLAGLVGHLTLTGIFFIWAGGDAFRAFKLPDPKWFIIGAVATLVVGAISFAIPPVRRVLVTKLLPILRRAVHGIGDVARRPSKLLGLFGGSVTVTFSYMITLYVALQAFGGGLPFATVGAVYLVGAAVATAAPTPGGLGAVEAALIAGLVSAGLDSAVAVPAVFLYRLATFWIPILPGWGCFTWLERREFI